MCEQKSKAWLLTAHEVFEDWNWDGDIVLLNWSWSRKLKLEWESKDAKRSSQINDQESVEVWCRSAPLVSIEPAGKSEFVREKRLKEKNTSRFTCNQFESPDMSKSMHVIRSAHVLQWMALQSHNFFEISKWARMKPWFHYSLNLKLISRYYGRELRMQQAENACFWSAKVCASRTEQPHKRKRNDELHLLQPGNVGAAS